MESPPVRLPRFLPLDALRGLIMVVMALDHANAFVGRTHPRPEMWTGPFPAYADPVAFLTRWVTHLAAPGFFFLLGSGIALFVDKRRQEGWSANAIFRHLALRGLFLIALQVLVEDPAWTLGSGSLRVPWEGGSLYVGVLYGLGSCLLVASVLWLLPAPWLLLFSTTLLLIIQTLFQDILPPASLGSPLEHLLLVPTASGPLVVYYPMLPWLPVVGLGIVFGRWLLRDPQRAGRAALGIGNAALGFGLVLRWVGGWGNIRALQGTDWISFLNMVKYPPSLTFLLFTLGIDLILFAAFARLGTLLRLVAHPLFVFGSSPLFFYLIHLYLYGILGILFAPRGTGVVGMYPYWLLGLVLLYPLCLWYGRFKATRSLSSVWRFL